MNNISIKWKLYILAIVIGVGLAALSTISANSISKIKLLDKTLLLVHESKSDMLTLRRNEKDFLARLDEKYVGRFNKNVSILKENIKSISNLNVEMDLGKNEEIQGILKYIDDYESSFLKIANINREIGLDHNSGLRGDLRSSVHSVESKLKNLDSIQLTADMLMLRRNEKDFMLRKLDKYIGKFSKNYKIFVQNLELSELDSGVKQDIRKGMSEYRTMILEFGQQYKVMGLTPKTGLHGKMRSDVHQVESAFDSLMMDLSEIVEDRSNSVYSQLLVLVAVLVGLIFGAIFAISRSINVRLGIIQSHLTDVAVGAGDLSVSLEVNGKDEVTVISTLFNQFVENLKKTFSQIPAFSESLGIASNINAGISSETYKLALLQQKKSDEMVEEIHQMVSATDKITGNIHTAASFSEHANESVGEGKNAIHGVSLSINTLADALQSSAELTHDLEGDSDDISAVLEVIRGIADQTNLLALNAAIEAARAGEHGRGFAVVADEVRTLASHTQDATTKIRTLIESLQGNVTNTVRVMRDGADGATSAVEAASNAIRSLDEIGDAVNVMVDLNEEISNASEEQSDISKNISTNILGINEAAKEAAAQSNRASESSVDINNIASDLELLISSYKF